MALLGFMEKKDSNCPNIIITPFQGVIVGTVVTSIEYYLYLRHLGADVELVLVNSNIKHRQTLIDYILDRYMVDKSIADNITVAPDKKLLFRPLKRALIHYNYFHSLQEYLVACEMVICLGSYGAQGVDVVVPDNYVYLKEPEYTKKILLQGLKSEIVYDNSCYLHIGSKLREGKADAAYILEKIKKLGLNRVSCYINPFDSFSREILEKEIEVHTDFIPGLFNRFNTYLYIHTGFFDYSPRMFIESSYLEKQILYINEYNVDDGCEQRYLDHIDGNYKPYMFSTNDKVIQLYA